MDIHRDFKIVKYRHKAVENYWGIFKEGSVDARLNIHN